ncbi:MAG: response regulator transcription factor [Edaphobacter sp.]
MKRPRILLASNRASSLVALRKSLEQEFEVVGVASDFKNLLAKGLKSEPDMILGDPKLSLWHEPNFKRKLKQVIPKTKVLLVSIGNEMDIASASLRPPVHGLAGRRSTAAKLIQVLQEFMELPDRTAETLPDSKYIFLAGHDATQSRELTQRQREVLKLLAEGRTMKQTGEILKLTTRTIAFHKYKIMRDFELHNNLELLRLAIREHLVSAD